MKRNIPQKIATLITALVVFGLSWTPLVKAEGVGDAALEFSTAALPAKYGTMHLGWFFYNMYMTEWYSMRADHLTIKASGTLFELAANKEANARLSQFDKEIGKEKKKKKRAKKEKERNEYMDSQLSSIDSSKTLDGGQKKKLAIALLQTATATIMQGKALRNAKRMIDGIPAAKTEATSIGNPLGKARTIKHLGSASKSLPSTVASSQKSLTRLAAISGHLNTLAKVNKVKAPSEKDVADAESSYVTEISFED